MHLEQLRRLMEQEVALLNEFGTQEELMHSFIKDHNWTGLNDTIARLKPLSDSIDQVERERHECFSSLKAGFKGGQETGFYQMIVHLPREERDTMASLYRELKISVLKIRGITATVDSYIRTVRDTVNGILDNVMPHRKGKLYNQSGSIRSIEPDALVVNTRV